MPILTKRQRPLKLSPYTETLLARAGWKLVMSTEGGCAIGGDNNGIVNIGSKPNRTRLYAYTYTDNEGLERKGCVEATSKLTAELRARSRCDTKHGETFIALKD